jgi:hypothetical protein
MSDSFVADVRKAGLSVADMKNNVLLERFRSEDRKETLILGFIKILPLVESYLAVERFNGQEGASVRVLSLRTALKAHNCVYAVEGAGGNPLPVLIDAFIAYPNAGWLFQKVTTFSGPYDRALGTAGFEGKTGAVVASGLASWNLEACGSAGMLLNAPQFSLIDFPERDCLCEAVPCGGNLAYRRLESEYGTAGPGTVYVRRARGSFIGPIVLENDRPNEQPVLNMCSGTCFNFSLVVEVEEKDAGKFSRPPLESSRAFSSS